MKRRVILIVALMVGGCSDSDPVVVLDGWWSADFTKETCSRAKAWSRENVAIIAQVGCEKVISCPEMTKIDAACTPDPLRELRAFDAELTTSFAAEPKCNSVRLVYYEGPNSSSGAVADVMQHPHWSLAIDFRPGEQKQSWTMTRSSEKRAFTSGEDIPREIAPRICAIAKEQGATIN